MNIGEPLKELGEIDYLPLKDRILSLNDDAWNANLSRQEMFDVANFRVILPVRPLAGISHP